MIEDRYNFYLKVTGEPTAAAVLVLVEATQAAALNESLSVEQAAERRGVHPSTIRKMIKAGTLPHSRLGTAIRIKAADLERSSEANRHGRLRVVN
jgi:excisionase family DNA binding protein